MSEGPEIVDVPKPEEKSKEQLFQENPERFEDLENCLILVKRNPENNALGILIRIGAKGQPSTLQVYEEALLVQSYIQRKISGFLSLIEGGMAKKANATGIVKPNGKGILNFARNGFRK